MTALAAPITRDRLGELWPAVVETLKPDVQLSLASARVVTAEQWNDRVTVGIHHGFETSLGNEQTITRLQGNSKQIGEAFTALTGLKVRVEWHGPSVSRYSEAKSTAEAREEITPPDLEWWEEETLTFLRAGDPRVGALLDRNIGMSAAEMWLEYPANRRMVHLGLAFLVFLEGVAKQHHDRPYDPGPAAVLVRARGAIAKRLGGYEFIPYRLYLRSTRWQQKRKQVLARDGHRCCLCNSPDNLNVHHRTYERRGVERLSDLTTLCRDCHAKFHDK